MRKFYSSGALSNMNPKSLQQKIFVELALHFGRRGKEGWRKLTKGSFEKKTDAAGREYVTLRYNEFDKNHRNAEVKGQFMFARNEDPNCPVKSFDLYVSRLNPSCDAFLQRPLTTFKDRDVWYANAPLGVHTISNMLKNISKEAGSSTMYTNHSLKASTATVLKQAGIPTQDIMAVTGHKNIASLQSYAQGPTIEDRAKMSSILASYGKEPPKVYDVAIPRTTSTNSTVTSSATYPMQSTPGNNTEHGAVTFNIQVNK